ncbi:MAG TPA: DUF4835 family protein [bacterium]|nr:DUF4835 family protein [bacterium]HPR88214.1 DUF4835 family protein [bacterium]
MRLSPITASRCCTVLLLLLLIAAGAARGQRIEAVVTTDLRTLPLERQDKLRDFKDKVEHYLNAYDWTNDPWNTVVYLDVQLILEDMSTSAEERYKGQIVISNKYDMQLSDKRWRFAYQSTDLLNHDENVMNSFTSMLDYFVYIILGMEFDKWSSLGGTEYFLKAKNIAEQSKFGLGRYIEGWDRRLEQITYLTGEQHLPFREMVDYYFYGLSLVKEDNIKARQFIGKAVEMLDKIIAKDPENEYAKMFLSAHYIEMVEVFRRAQDKSPLRTLMVIDPAHAQVYRNIIEK